MILRIVHQTKTWQYIFWYMYNSTKQSLKHVQQKYLKPAGHLFMWVDTCIKWITRALLSQHFLNLWWSVWVVGTINTNLVYRPCQSISVHVGVTPTLDSPKCIWNGDFRVLKWQSQKKRWEIPEFHTNISPRGGWQGVTLKMVMFSYV